MAAMKALRKCLVFQLKLQQLVPHEVTSLQYTTDNHLWELVLGCVHGT